MTNNSISFVSLSLDNGSGMTRKWLDKGSTIPRKLFSLLFVLFFCIGQMWGTEYQLCTSTSDLEAGAKYIIGNGSSGSVKFMSTTSEANYRHETSDRTVTNNKVTATDDMLVLTLGGSIGAWTLYTYNYAGTAGYLASAASGNNNYCRVLTSSNTGTITFSNSAAVIDLGPHSSRTTLRYNGTNTRFACYSSGQAAVYLYKEVASKTLSSIAITTPPSTTKYLNGETFSSSGAVVTATYSDATSANVASATTWNKTTLSTSDVKVTASYTEGGVTKTADQDINVYSVTVQKQNETSATITAEGVSAFASGRTLTASASAASKYVFKGWKYETAAGTSIASAGSANTTLNGTPTGNVTIIAEFYAPLTATWMVAGSEWTGKGEQTTFARGSHVSALPTAPNPNNSEGCGDKFVGWTTVEEYAHGSSPLYTSASQIPNATTNQIFYAVFADYDE